MKQPLQSLFIQKLLIFTSSVYTEYPYQRLVSRHSHKAAAAAAAGWPPQPCEPRLVSPPALLTLPPEKGC